MSSKTPRNPLSVTPSAASATFSHEDSIYLSNHLDFNGYSLDARRIIMFLFSHREVFFSEATIRNESGYCLSHEVFVRDITAFEERLIRAKNAPLRLMRRGADRESYTYSIVSREFFIQAEARRVIALTSGITKRAVQETTPTWDSQAWLDSVDYIPISDPLRFVHSPTSVNAQVRSHCIYTCLTQLAAHANEWVTMIDLESAITSSLQAIPLPPRYIWSNNFTLLELVREMQANLSVTKNNTLLISTQDTPRSYKLEVPTDSKA